ncbi:MAG: phage integrase N-terminal SAM-like domain-containing protein [Betaproteobacteria bacterium]
MPEPPRAPRLLDQLRQQIRYRHYSLRTEQCCVQWVRRFIRCHDANRLMALERVAEVRSVRPQPPSGRPAGRHSGTTPACLTDWAPRA